MVFETKGNAFKSSCEHQYLAQVNPVNGSQAGRNTRAEFHHKLHIKYTEKCVT